VDIISNTMADSDSIARSLAPSDYGDEQEVKNSKRRLSIARSLVQAHSLLVEKEDEKACLELAFNNLDVKNDNVLDRSELTLFMQEAAKYVRLQVDSDVVEDAVDALLEDVSDDNDLEHITREQFYDIFHRHPDMLRVFDDESSLADLRESVRSHQLSQKERNRFEKDQEEVWAHAHTHWKSKRAVRPGRRCFCSPDLVCSNHSFLFPVAVGDRLALSLHLWKRLCLCLQGH
jgi:hypothetical protein